MIMTGKELTRLADVILRITGREEHSKTMDNKIRILYRFEKGEIILARWSDPEDSIVVKTYDRSVSDWSVERIVDDMVTAICNDGIELEVVWDA